MNATTNQCDKVISAAESLSATCKATCETIDQINANTAARLEQWKREDAVLLLMDEIYNKFEAVRLERQGNLVEFSFRECLERKDASVAYAHGKFVAIVWDEQNQWSVLAWFDEPSLAIEYATNDERNGMVWPEHTRTFARQGKLMEAISE